MPARALLLGPLLAASWLSLGACGGLDGTDAGDKPGACIADNQRCLDPMTPEACRQLSVEEGVDVLFWAGETCSEHAYFETCPGEVGKLKSCP